MEARVYMVEYIVVSMAVHLCGGVDPSTMKSIEMIA